MIWKIWKNTMLKCEMVWKIWKKGKSNSDKIWTIWKKGKLNSEEIWKIWKKRKLNGEKIWKIRKKSKLKCEMIWKLWKKGKSKSDKIWTIRKKDKFKSALWVLVCFWVNLRTHLEGMTDRISVFLSRAKCGLNGLEHKMYSLKSHASYIKLKKCIRFSISEISFPYFNLQKNIHTKFKMLAQKSIWST